MKGISIRYSTLALVLTASASAQVLDDNQLLVNFPGQGFMGADVSEDTSGAWGYSIFPSWRIAEDFTVTDSGGWDVSHIRVYGYMTGSPNSPTPFTECYMRIWDGDPTIGANVVWGDTTTNVFGSSAWTNIYRIPPAGDFMNVDRAIFYIEVPVGTNLPQGTYWMDFQLDGVVGSGPWMPSNPSTVGNAAYQSNTDWATFTALPESVPYKVMGTVSGGGLGTNFECPMTVVNSSGNAATILATGSDVAADNDVTLTATGMPTLNPTFGYFLNSMNQNLAGFMPPGSQGLLCIGPAGMGRYNVSVFNASGTGQGSLVLDLMSTPTPTGPVVIQAGETWYFTAWFRDSNPGSTSNFTDAVGILFQ